MIHNANTRVKDNLIKSMKPESTLWDILATAKSVESTIITEKLSKGDGKPQVQVDSVNKQGHSASMGSGQYKPHSNSKGRSQKSGKLCNKCWKIPPKQCTSFGKTCYKCKKKDISLNFAIHIQAPDHHQMIKDNPVRIFMRLHNQITLMVICSHMILM